MRTFFEVNDKSAKCTKKTLCYRPYGTGVKHDYVSVIDSHFWKDIVILSNWLVFTKSDKPVTGYLPHKKQ